MSLTGHIFPSYPKVTPPTPKSPTCSGAQFLLVFPGCRSQLWPFQGCKGACGWRWVLSKARRCFASWGKSPFRGSWLFGLGSPMGCRMGAPYNILGGTHLPPGLAPRHPLPSGSPKQSPSFQVGAPRSQGVFQASGQNAKGEGPRGRPGAAGELAFVQHLLGVPGHTRPTAILKHPLYAGRGARSRSEL